MKKDFGAPMLIVVLVAFAALASETISGEGAPQRSFAAHESLLPNERLVDASEIAAAAPAEPALRPVVDTSAASEPAPAPEAAREPQAASEPEAVREPRPARARIRVEARRAGTDERIQQAVLRAIARAPHISGCIDVETSGARVRLSGWTMTAGQSLRAEKAAARVKGVRHVSNEIRPRVGAVHS